MRARAILRPIQTPPLPRTLRHMESNTTRSAPTETTRQLVARAPNVRASVSHVWLVAVLMALLAVVFAQSGSATTRNQPQTIAEGLKSQAFRDAYRRAFAPYLGLLWVSKPVLEESPKSESLSDGRNVWIFVTCRPHACTNERLSFAFEPSTGRGWGLIHIKSDVVGDVSGEPIDISLTKALGGK